MAGSRVTAPALIDAWMHFHDLTETRDPLSQSLLDAERARPFNVAKRDGSETAVTRAFDVDGDTGRLVRADGTLDPTLHVAGIPVDDTLHDTIISPMPGTDPPMLRETDRVARSALAIAGVSVTAARQGSQSAPHAAPSAVPQR
ncbi:hypothetical protein [Leucobacter coleopterorum]|uniref:hypothetical protein n=1 Tax=Leucobacter coleopterorum TaxID=2714933 RepID=UPI001FCC7E28|nr:hypothetical protein [Leucobacter coleopterorum]